VRTPLCDSLGIEFPIFAFTHCRDVVAAVSRAGGFGVLGAVGFPPEQLEIELAWIDDNVGNHPYGVDVVIPGKYEGMGEADPARLADQLRAMVPERHLEFARKVLADHGVPDLPDGETRTGQLLGWTAATATPQVEIALKHDKVALIANALGTPPPDIIAEIRDAGRLVAALCGSPEQARRHRDAGVDIIIAQGSEGGGHTGEVGSVVLWPQVIAAVAPTPVLAAGGNRVGGPDRRRPGHGRGRRVERITVADGRRIRASTRPARPAPRRRQPGYHPFPSLHRQALPHAPQRLDRCLGPAGYS
jgi:NAD(P)H-dependent flavin oxidoreductase YrpB (nitropropane dioxygenase family)